MSDAIAAPMSHGDFNEVFPDVFWMQGTVKMGPGMVINRNMIVLRHEGELTVINAVRPEEHRVAELEALGTVKDVVKLGLHGMDDAWYLQRFGARFWAAPGADVGGLTVDQPLTPDGPRLTPWARVFRFQETKKPELALIIERGGGVLVTCDSVQNWSNKARCSLLAKGLTAIMGFDKRPANIGPPWKKLMTPADGSLKPDFERLLAEPFDNLIGGHGQPMTGGAKAALTATVAAVFGGA